MEKHDVRHIRTLHTKDGRNCEIWYYGKTKIHKDDIVIRISIAAEKCILELFAATRSAEVLTGLLAEIERDLKHGVEFRVSGKDNVINVTIKDSVIQKSNPLDLCSMDGTCPVNILVEDSVIQHSNLISEREEAKEERLRKEREERERLLRQQEEEARLRKVEEEKLRREKEEEEELKRKEIEKKERLRRQQEEAARNIEEIKRKAQEEADKRKKEQEEKQQEELRRQREEKLKKREEEDRQRKQKEANERLKQEMEELRKQREKEENKKKEKEAQERKQREERERKRREEEEKLQRLMDRKAGVYADRSIEIKRGYEVLPDNRVRFGIRVINNGDSAISDVEVILDYSHSLFELEGSRIEELGTIPPSIPRTAKFILKPLGCVHTEEVGATVRYRDHKWEKCTFDMRPKEIHCVCPFLKEKTITRTDFLKLFNGGYPAERGLNFENIQLEKVAGFITHTCKNRLYKVDEFPLENGKILYLAGDSVGEKAYYLLTVVVVEREGIVQVLFQAKSDKEFGINGFLNEIVENLRHLVQSLSAAKEIGIIKNEQVINIIDSVVQHTNFSSKTGSSSVNIQDSVVQRTNFESSEDELNLHSADVHRCRIYLPICPLLSC